MHKTSGRTSPRLILLAGALSLPLTACTAGPGPGDGEPAESTGSQRRESATDGAAQHASDSVLVRFRSSPGAAARRRSLDFVGGSIDDANGDGIDDRYRHLAGGELALVRLAPGAHVADAIEALERDPAVVYAEPNYIVHAAAAPNDPRFPELHGMDNTGQTGGTPDADIDAPEAWDSSVGSRDVVVGVVDTGIDHGHEDLAANAWVNPGEVPGNAVDDDGNGVIDDVHGFNALAASGDPLDDNGHGTHVAGTLGAVGDNGVGVVGVNWAVQVMGLKFLSASGSGTLADAIAVIDYAVAQRNAGVNLRVLSNSWGGGGFSQALLDAITAASDAGILFVATAGGSASDNDVVPSYPASYEAPNVVAVAATDDNDQLASFSNFGATSVDLGAPGVNILSTTLGNSYSVFSGTSMATPHVSGVAALALSVNPTLDTAALVAILLTSGDPVPALQGITVSGQRLNAAGAVSQAAAVE
jgi:subtilisin family serine protease